MAIVKGWVNLHIVLPEGEIVASRRPYSSKQEAEAGIYMGAGIQKLGCFEVEWERPSTLSEVDNHEPK